MSAAPRPLDRFAVLVTLGLATTWGLNQVMIKLALADLAPITQSGLRAAAATLFVGGYTLAFKREIFRRDETLVAGLVVGFLFALEFIFIYLGVRLTTAARTATFVFSAPLFVALGAVFVLPNERLQPLQWAGMALAFAGVVVGLGAHTEGADFVGDGLALLGAILWAATTIVIKATSLRRADPIKVLLYQIGVTTLVSPPAAFLAGEPLPTHLSVAAGFSLLYQSVFIVGVTYIIWFRLLSTYRASELSAFTFLTPIVGVFAGAVVLGETITPTFLAALALVAAGIILVNRSSRAPAAVPDALRDPG